MTYNRPTIATLLSRFRSDVESSVDKVFAWLRRGILPGLGKALVGLTHGQYGYIQYISKQIVAGYATDTAVIDSHASLYLKQGRKSAYGSTGPVDIAGTDGKVLAAGSIYQRSDGIQYETAADATIAGGVATVTVNCLTGGLNTDAVAGTTLTLTQSADGIKSVATVSTAGLTGGSDPETNDQVNSRIRDRISKSPNGSNLDQYSVWALEVAGVTRAWPFSNWSGYGTVGLFFVRDGDVDIIPTAAEVQAVQDYIDPLRPAGMKGFTAIAPTKVIQDFTIKLNPNTAAVQAAVQTAIQELFQRETTVEDGTGSGKMPISHINEAISNADGEYDHLVVTPAADITLTAGQLLTVGNFTWQAL